MSCPDTTPKSTSQKLAASGLPAPAASPNPAHTERLARLGLKPFQYDDVHEAILRGDLSAEQASVFLPELPMYTLQRDERDAAYVAELVSSGLENGKLPDESEVVRAVSGFDVNELKGKAPARLKSLRYARAYQIVRAYIDGRLDSESFEQINFDEDICFRLERWFKRRPAMTPEQFCRVMNHITPYSLAEWEWEAMHCELVLEALKDGVNLPQAALDDYDELYDFNDGWKMPMNKFLRSCMLPEIVSHVSHRALVRDALLRGETVPPEVLAEYPDLLQLFNMPPDSRKVRPAVKILNQARRTPLPYFLKMCEEIGMTDENARALHRERVLLALRQGKSVHMDVLLDHPDLMAEYGLSA